ncbi:MAG: c-type cytochrome, partial [Mariprofundales bacterium]|nr:c-type cytochrome [Mariprofundales bacterium]
MKGSMGFAGAVAFMLVTAAPVAVVAHEAMGNIDNGRAIFQNGKGDDVPACAGCHGVDGLGSDDMGSPRLAYQVDSYILKQLEDFATDKRTDNTMYQMNDIAKALSPTERRDVSAFVHTLKTPFMGSDLDELRANDIAVGAPYKGEVLATYGAP